MTRQEIISAMMRAAPFEGSSYERSAHEVFAAGITSVEPGYDSLDDAESDWRMEYDADIADLADAIASTGDPRMWAPKERA